jgi:hypothetical protein
LRSRPSGTSPLGLAAAAMPKLDPLTVAAAGMPNHTVAAMPV